jgi:histidyl-tRNA synthetase
MELRTPRGMRDFMPGEMSARSRVISIVEAAFKRYGYEQIDTPVLENLDVLSLKCGEDTTKLIYKTEDGKLGLRFDLTVPFARVVAGNPALPKPFKRYCIAKVWRREEPQKGRFREFLQADVDVAGSEKMECEAELISCACEALRELGFSDFKVRLNSRKILEGVIKKIGITEKPEAVFRALDKIDKIGRTGVEAELEKAGVGKKEMDELVELILKKDGNEEMLKQVEKESPGGAAEIKEILGLCALYGEKNVSFDLSLMRGLDYYTGPVFEISAGGGIGSIGGGGRYDGLIDGYGGGKVPAVGISLGIERIMELLGKNGKASEVEVFVANVKPEFYPDALKAAREIRKGGIAVQVDLMGRNLRKQLEYANAKGIGFVGVIGGNEAKEGTITLRNLKTGKEQKVPLGQAAEIVKGA